MGIHHWADSDIYLIVTKSLQNRQGVGALQQEFCKGTLIKNDRLFPRRLLLDQHLRQPIRGIETISCSWRVGRCEIVCALPTHARSKLSTLGFQPIVKG